MCPLSAGTDARLSIARPLFIFTAARRTSCGTPSPSHCSQQYGAVSGHL